MFRNKFGKVAPIAVLLNCLLVSMIAVAAEKISNPEELVAKHLESLGTAQARSDAKSRADEGTVQFRVLSGGWDRSTASQFCFPRDARYF